MKKKIRIGILCALALALLAALVFLILREPAASHISKPDPTTPTQGTEDSADGQSDPTKPTDGKEDPTEPSKGKDDPTEPTDGKEDPTEPTEGEDEPKLPDDGQVTPPNDLPASVIIPTVKDPETGESVGITFPCQVPGYGLVIEKMAPYSGMFVEDGSNVNVENVAMLLVYNNGDFPVEYTQISVQYGEQSLLFDISALPVGERLVVQEKNGIAIPEEIPVTATAMVVQRADMAMSENQIKVTDNGNNTLTIQNLTDKVIPTVRVFYKYYMQEQGVFVGGIAFTLRITRLNAGAKITVRPSHYTSSTSRVVMVLTYDSEV